MSAKIPLNVQCIFQKISQVSELGTRTGGLSFYLLGCHLSPSDVILITVGGNIIVFSFPKRNLQSILLELDFSLLFPSLAIFKNDLVLLILLLYHTE